MTASGSLSSAVSDVFEPGSTGKVITMAAILDNKIADPLVAVGGARTRTRPTARRRSRTRTSTGSCDLTTTGVLAESSNTGTVMIGQNLPVQTRYDYLAKFGFGAQTGIEMSGESKGILHPVDTWQRRDKFAVLFGQARVRDRAAGHAGLRDDRQRRGARAAAHHQGLDVAGRHLHPDRPRRRRPRSCRRRPPRPCSP